MKYSQEMEIKDFKIDRQTKTPSSSKQKEGKRGRADENQEVFNQQNKIISKSIKGILEALLSNNNLIFEHSISLFKTNGDKWLEEIRSKYKYNENSNVKLKESKLKVSVDEDECQKHHLRISDSNEKTLKKKAIITKEKPFTLKNAQLMYIKGLSISEYMEYTLELVKLVLDAVMAHAQGKVGKEFFSRELYGRAAEEIKLINFEKIDKEVNLDEEAQESAEQQYPKLKFQQHQGNKKVTTMAVTTETRRTYNLISSCICYKCEKTGKFLESTSPLSKKGN